MQLSVEKRRDLSSKSHHREQVDAIDRRRDVEHLVSDRKRVHERRSGLDAVGEHHDSPVLVAEADLVLGQDHPVRALAAELALLERLIEDRELRPGQRDRHGGAGLEVVGAADDLAGVSVPHVDPAHAQPVSVRMLLDLEHPAHEEAPEVPVDVRNAGFDDALDLERGHGKPSSHRLGGRVDRDVLTEPGERCAHQNWESSRGSFRQSSRRSGMPCRSTAIRSSPQPNAKPV